MKFFIPYIQIIFIFLTSSLFAVPANFEEEGEDFVKDLLRAIPEKANGLSSSKARKALFDKMQQRNVFKLDASIRRRLENREDPYSEIAVNIRVRELEKVAGDDKYAKFLLTKIREKRLDEGEQVITMREMVYQTGELQALIKLKELRALAARKEPLKKLVSFYQDFTGQQKKTAETLEDLGLPDELKFAADGKAWQYYGGPGHSLILAKKKVLFIEPTPDAQGQLLAVDIKNAPFLVSESAVEAAKVAYAKAIAVKAKEVEARKKPDPKIVAAQEKAAQEKIEAYKKSIRENLLQVGARIKILQEEGMLPTEFKDLKLKKALETVKSADGKSSSALIYLEGKLNVKAGEKKRLLVISPYSVDDGRYLVLLDDGSTAMINDEQMKKIQSALSNLSNNTVSVENLGALFPAIPFDSESHPNDDEKVRDFGGKIQYITDDTWVCYKAFNFGPRASKITVSASSKRSGGNIQVKIGSPEADKGTLLGTVKVTKTKGWDDFQTFSAKLDSSVVGNEDLYFVFTGRAEFLMNIESFQID